MGDLDVLAAAGIDLLICVVVMGLTAWISWRVGRVSVVDVAWGLAFVAVALGARGRLRRSGCRGCSPALVTIWGGRLALHIHRRSRGHGEDPRYAAMLGDAGFGTVVRKVFAVQGLAVFLVSLPLVTRCGVRRAVAVAGGRRCRCVAGRLGVRGRRRRAAGGVQASSRRTRSRRSWQTGLWRFTRHPNYFGDACIWWGIWLAGALSLGWLPGLLTIIAPVAMTYFLAFATGARLLERTMMQRPRLSGVRRSHLDVRPAAASRRIDRVAAPLTPLASGSRVR